MENTTTHNKRPTRPNKRARIARKKAKTIAMTDARMKSDLDAAAIPKGLRMNSFQGFHSGAASFCGVGYSSGVDPASIALRDLDEIATKRKNDACVDPSVKAFFDLTPMQREAIRYRQANVAKKIARDMRIALD